MLALRIRAVKARRLFLIAASLILVSVGVHLGLNNAREPSGVELKSHDSGPGDTGDAEPDRLVEPSTAFFSDRHVVPADDMSAFEEARKPRRVMPPSLLPFEQTLLIGDSVDVGVIGPLLSGPDFMQSVSGLKSQMLDDPLARELGSLYGERIESLLKETSLRLGDFACGLSVCLGVIHASSEGGEWNTFRESFRGNSSGLTVTTFGEFSAVGNETADTEHRFIFTTDSAIRSASGSFRSPN